MICISLLALSVALPIVWALSKGDKLPASNPSAFVKRIMGSERPDSVILFAGDSLTHGNIGIGYLNILREEQHIIAHELINAGINGDF